MLPQLFSLQKQHLFKENITKNISGKYVVFFLLDNTGKIKHNLSYFSSASPHNGININVYGNELFFEEGHLFIFDSLM